MQVPKEICHSPQMLVKVDCTSLYLIFNPLKFKLTDFDTMVELSNILNSVHSQTIFLEDREHLGVLPSVSS